MLLQCQIFLLQSHHDLNFIKYASFQGNYVLENDSLLCAEQTQFDTILCLSITKWIHLNFGDAGLKQTFKRMHAQLRPGGVLVLEPQGWASYTKKKNLTVSNALCDCLIFLCNIFKIKASNNTVYTNSTLLLKKCIYIYCFLNF